MKNTISGWKPKPRNKYGAKKEVVDGITFHSKKEAKRYRELKLLEKAGEISGLKLQEEFPVWINGEKVFTYRADFSYFTENGRVVEDCKGFRTQIYRLKRKSVQAYYGIKITEV